MKPIIITGILLLGALSFAAADEPNAKSILQKSADAINQLNSFKADMIIDSFASLTPQKGVVYQKNNLMEPSLCEWKWLLLPMQSLKE